MLALAQECGLRVARHRIETVADKGVLLLQRFDRTLTTEGYLRHRMVSGLTALGAEDSHGDRTKWSYLLLADGLRRRSARSNQDLEELFRRTVFNVRWRSSTMFNRRVPRAGTRYYGSTARRPQNACGWQRRLTTQGLNLPPRWCSLKSRRRAPCAAAKGEPIERSKPALSRRGPSGQRARHDTHVQVVA